MSTHRDVITPADLGRELGHNDGNRPGITVRRYLRQRYPDHLKSQRWELTREQADDVRAHFGGRAVSPTASHAEPPHALAESAISALSAQRWPIVEAVQHVPAQPGLYAIYGDEQAWSDLGLDGSVGLPLYVGKAEDSLVSRDLNGHFATNPISQPRTGSSTVRRSFAALLRDALDLQAVPRNLANPERFANYGLTPEGDARLNEWMHARLTLAVWPATGEMSACLKDVETAVIVHFTPPINLEKNPDKLARLSRARAEMADEASRWRAEGSAV